MQCDEGQTTKKRQVQEKDNGKEQNKNEHHSYSWSRTAAGQVGHPSC